MPPLGAPPFLLSLLLLFLLLSAAANAAGAISLPPSPAPTAAPTTSTSPLDPKQVQALRALNVPAGKNPCAHGGSAAVCDGGTPFRHLISLTLANCSDEVSLSSAALKSLSTLTSLHFLNCPAAAVHLPADLAASLRSFSAVNSLRHLTGVYLSRLRNLTDLTVSSVPVTASGPYVIIGNMKKLTSVTISAANLTGFVPKHLNPNTTHIDFSQNKLRGKIPNSITLLENLISLNLSSNTLAGEIPIDIGDLISLTTLSLSRNTLAGPIPESLSAVPSLTHLDLSSNNLNGTIPKFISDIKTLETLNLAGNNFHGVLPFNSTFIRSLAVFRVAGNTNLCYNHTLLSSKLKLGIAQCDKHGLPLSPPPAKDSSSADDGSDDDYDDTSEDEDTQKSDQHHGPSKVVLGVAIGLSSIVFLIVFLVLISKCCG